MELMLAIVAVAMVAFLSHLAMDFGLKPRATAESGESEAGS
jgi:hypothetical protein